MRDEEFVLPGASGAVSFPAGASFRSKGAIGRASTKFFPSRRETTALGLLTAASIVFVAGILRGMTGFGFALVAAIGLAHVWPPAMATPVVLLLSCWSIPEDIRQRSMHKSQAFKSRSNGGAYILFKIDSNVVSFSVGQQGVIWHNYIRILTR